MDAEEEVSFNQAGARNGDQSGDVGLSNDELPKQLTLAEQEMDEGIASRYATPTEEVELRVADEEKPPSSASAQAATQGTVEETSAERELTALDEHEKELG